MSSGLSLTLLGGLRIMLDGEPVERLLTSKAAVLLAYLAVTGRPHRRTALASLLWGETAEEKAQASLRTALSTLNRAFPSYLHVTRQTVALDPARPAWVDASAFEQGVEQALGEAAAGRGTLSRAQAQGLRQALALYEGDFLASCPVYDAPEFEEWLAGERERLRQLAWQAMYVLAAHYKELGAYQRGIEVARRLLALEPWNEESHRQLMGLLALNGQRSAALAQYESCCRVLAAELGVAPTRKTTILYEQIQSGQVQPRPAPVSTAEPPVLRHGLPRQMTPFVGRKEELTQLKELLLDPTYPLVTVVGPGGVGKTRLALAAAEQVSPHFSDGVCFVPLAGLGGADAWASAAAGPFPDSASAEPILAWAIARALEFSFSGRGSPQEELVAYLRRKDKLLILDNAEHLLPASNLVLALLREAPGCALLATSRERLNLQAEYLVRLGGMRFPDRADDPEAAHYSGVQLFAERAARAGGGFSLTRDNLPDVVRICQLLDGLPLGIELAATWVERLVCASIADTIVRKLDLLETSLHDVPERHRSLRAVLLGSWDLLPLPERCLLAGLSVFRGRFSAAAAQAVTGGSSAELASLEARSLLRQESPGYYTLHELLRQFTAEQLGAEEQAVAGRHSDYYLEFVGQREKMLSGRAGKRTLDEIRGEADNIRQAWLWAVAHSRFAAVDRALDTLSLATRITDLTTVGETLLGTAAEHLRKHIAAAGQPSPGDQLLLGRVLAEQALFLDALAQYEQAAVATGFVLDLAQAVLESGQDETRQRATRLQAAGQHLRGQSLLRQGKPAAAREQFEQALALARSAQVQQVEATSLLALGVLAHRQGDRSSAAAHFERALAVYRTLEDRRGEGRALSYLGTNCSETDPPRARVYLEEALQIRREVGDQRGEAMTQNNLGALLDQMGHYDQARACFEQALAISRELGAREGESDALNNLGMMSQYLGRYDWARSRFVEALALKEEIGDRWGQVAVQASLSLLCHLQGDDELAREHGQNALEAARDLGARQFEADALNYLGHALAGLGQFDQAHAAYEQALEIRHDIGLVNPTMESLAGLARVALAQGSVAPAQAYVAAILDHLQSGTLDGTEEPFRIYLTCYRVLQAAGDPRAAELLRTAYLLLQQRAAAIGDRALRRAFLQNVAAHRELEEAYAQSLEKKV
jgi:DNA-binding SARP family transcriptional activator/predicted ATPase/Tfp pilus assembly protein PilF